MCLQGVGTQLTLVFGVSPALLCLHPRAVSAVLSKSRWDSTSHTGSAELVGGGSCEWKTLSVGKAYKHPRLPVLASLCTWLSSLNDPIKILQRSQPPKSGDLMFSREDFVRLPESVFVRRVRP
ncbi:hypothetical protein B0H13DRAFT_1850275 [Mycena leptocephala]|nr:hypothetical protein B0H13DRAFT_1850275 [Mycena leptocephala]